MRRKVTVTAPKGRSGKYIYRVQVGRYPFLTVYRGDGATLEEARSAALDRIPEDQKAARGLTRH